MTETCAFSYQNISQKFIVDEKVRFWQRNSNAENKEYRVEKGTQK